MVVIEPAVEPQKEEETSTSHEIPTFPSLVVPPKPSEPEDGCVSEDDRFEDALTEEELKEMLHNVRYLCVTRMESIVNIFKCMSKSLLFVGRHARLCDFEPKMTFRKALNQASDAKTEGNKLFQAGQYDEALSKYDHSLQIASEITSSEELRSMCHANRAVCFLKLYFALGKYDDTIKECNKALELNPSYVKALIRRGEAHEKLEHYEEAISDMKKIIELDPSNEQAKKNMWRLEPLAAEKREKLKEEMIGKLKDMGNNLLGRFGMSVDNFKAVKDPNTGSYSISFQR
ncbi:TPR repeat-containing thioredoxin TTL4 [Apostasia shenzhenica]|uniref:TPR repeat-containing thioredoxin TTL4 n=1 Tax=Apostasia shenzhenica TaxID=1088818 RepID=A0A2I0A7K8_9ASPA|nr:TPR repeat-containing thioredoxin TTL4 [Apostasia shenzhenica]